MIETSSVPAVAPQESLGTQLNRMSGVNTQENLYAPKNKMDKETFLRMFTEQLRNQDPLNPVSNEQFSQQMAMFAQLEQQIATNKNLEQMLQHQNNTQIAALQLVGKNILADKATIYHSPEKHTNLSFKLPQDASNVDLEVTDAGGQVVKKIGLGAQTSGMVNTKWDGFNDEGRPMDAGRYSFRVKAQGMDGKEIIVPTKVDGKVSGVTSDKGVVYLLVGDQKVALNDVETIKAEEENKNPTTPGPQSIDAGVKKEGTNPVPVAQKPAISIQLDENSPGTKTEPPSRQTENVKNDESDRPTMMELVDEGVQAPQSHLDALMPLFFR